MSPAVSGYADARQLYRDAGWTPLPLKRGAKWPPPEGYTGQERLTPDDRKYRRWSRQYPDGNLCLPMPNGVVGIDIDAYHGGVKTYRDLARKLGRLPDTVWSSSREDGSGIYFYTVQRGTKLVGKLDGGIEIIQRHHRYAVVWPSTHPEGRQYTWHQLENADSLNGVPYADDFPWLPDSWVEELLAANKRHDGIGFGGAVEDWLSALPGGRLASVTDAWLKDVTDRLGREGGRYDTMLRAVGRLVRLGAQGKRGIYDALVNLRSRIRGGCRRGTWAQPGIRVSPCTTGRGGKVRGSPRDQRVETEDP
jgi:hypothetical protein